MVVVSGDTGSGKTTLANGLARSIDAGYGRIQFTPDLLPSDVIGTQVYSPKSESFSVKQGPVFANFILADEINRAPAKVQSALLEAMQEHQVTIGEKTYKIRTDASISWKGGAIYSDEACTTTVTDLSWVNGGSATVYAK